MKSVPTRLPGVVLIEPVLFPDARGYFYECHHEAKFVQMGLPGRFVQDNVSRSHRHTLRGLHYQLEPHAQGKLIIVHEGSIYDVAVDIRRHSPTYGTWVGYVLSGTNRLSLYVPEGFAHGFLVLSDTAEVTYKCTRYYHPASERSIVWDDPDLKIDWPALPELLSDKDRNAPRLKDAENNFVYAPPSPGA